MNAPPPIAAERIPNHLAWAILSAIFSFCLCCFVGGIPGIVAIVYAANITSPPPPNPRMIGYAGLAAWLFVPWGYWIDRHRRLRT